MANVEALLNLPHFPACLAEEDGFWETWRATAGEVSVRGNLVPDAHLAALLRFHGVRRIYTHDRTFGDSTFWTCRIHSPDAQVPAGGEDSATGLPCQPHVQSRCRLPPSGQPGLAARPPDPSRRPASCLPPRKTCGTSKLAL